MLLLERGPFQRSLADFRASQKSGLARGADWASIRRVAGNPPRVSTDAHQDHTPSLCGRRADSLASLPDFFAGGCVGPDVGQTKTKNAALPELGKAQRFGQACKSSEGTGICQFETSFWGLPGVSASQRAATLWVNRPLAAALSARALRRSRAVRSFRVRPSVRPATSHIANLTPASVAVSDTHRFYHRLTSENRAQQRPVCPAFSPPFHADRAAQADAVLCVSLKTQKDVPCSRKS